MGGRQAKGEILNPGTAFWTARALFYSFLYILYGGRQDARTPRRQELKEVHASLTGKILASWHPGGLHTGQLIRVYIPLLGVLEIHF
jgi:hypothetical protein